MRTNVFENEQELSNYLHELIDKRSKRDEYFSRQFALLYPNWDDLPIDTKIREIFGNFHRREFLDIFYSKWNINYRLKRLVKEIFEYFFRNKILIFLPEYTRYGQFFITLYYTYFIKNEEIQIKVWDFCHEWPVDLKKLDNFLKKYHLIFVVRNEDKFKRYHTGIFLNCDENGTFID